MIGGISTTFSVSIFEFSDPVFSEFVNFIE
jgi:hypothetical protein